MKKGFKRMLCLLLAAALLVSVSAFAFADKSTGVKVGVGKADITGPITDISTGYNSLGDLMEGLLTRLYARAFVVDSGAAPMVYVSAELVHMTESIKPGVLAALKADGYSCFSEENVMITATHCHSSSSNTSWYALYDLINGVPGYDDESYDVIVKGITEAIEKAYDTRVSGTVSLVYGETSIEASNRSADAFLTNVNVGDYGYEVNADGSFSYETGLAAAKNAYNHEMAGIVLTDANGRDIGFLNFFGSHGTSNGIDNTYIASDHKGYAALAVEQAMGDGFVAAFAQADSGDTSPNAINESDYHDAFLRPNEVDSSVDVIENQIVYGRQEAAAAMQLINSAQRTVLTGDFDFNYTAVDFSEITVDLDYVGDYYMPYDDLSAGSVATSEACIGAGIIAGDEEGAPVDNAAEGAVKHNFVWNEETQSYDKISCDFTMIDLYGLQYLFEPLWPTAMKILQSDEYDDVQAEKVVCLAVGDLMQETQPLQIMRMGALAIVGVPFELTYEQANRTRAVLEDTLAEAGVTKVIIATHANAYSQYVVTREEFAAQHYEGATCLFGPWSGAALTQELDKLAQGIVSGETADKGAALTQTEPFGLVYTAAALADPLPDTSEYGTVVSDVSKTSYETGEWVSASFSGVNTRHICMLRLADSELVNNYTYMEVQKLVDGEWTTYLTDTSPYTTFKSTDSGLVAKSYTSTVSWLIKGDTAQPGTYRLVYNGIAKVCDIENVLKCISANGYVPFSVASSEFTVNGTEEPQEPENENPFEDVSESAYYYDAVLWAYNHEPEQIAYGYDETHFVPDDSCTRGQIVTFLWRAADCPEPESNENPFTDVNEDSYCYDAVMWAVEKGIVCGYGNGLFGVNDTCTRAQAVTFLWRSEGKPAAGKMADFNDIADLNDEFKTAISWAVENNVTAGIGNGMFGPDNDCTRAQIVTLLYNYYK